jgi:hypothetical protein
MISPDRDSAMFFMGNAPFNPSEARRREYLILAAFDQEKP